MDYSYFIDREMHMPLRWLGRNSKLNIIPGTYPRMGIDLEILNRKVPDTYAEVLGPMMRRLNGPRTRGADVAALYFHARVLADGPKIIKPTLRQCQALAEMTVDIEVAEFGQPFSNVILILPEEYRAELTARFNYPAPVWVMSIWEADQQLLAVGAHYQEVRNPEEMPSDIVALLPHTPGKTIEQRLRLRTDDTVLDGSLEEHGPEFDMAEMVERIALNMGMILMEGPVQLAPVDKKALDKAKAMSSSKNPERRQIGTKFLAGQIFEILPDQSITFYEEKFISMPSEGEPVEGSRPSSSKKPHWRRGHWHRYWTGSGDLKKCIRKLIKPVFVMRDRFLGDPADVAVQYKTRDSRTGGSHAA